MALDGARYVNSSCLPHSSLGIRKYRNLKLFKDTSSKILDVIAHCLEYGPILIVQKILI